MNVQAYPVWELISVKPQNHLITVQCSAVLFQLRYQRALEDLKTKNLSIQDSAKKYAEMQHR